MSAWDEYVASDQYRRRDGRQPDDRDTIEDALGSLNLVLKMLNDDRYWMVTTDAMLQAAMAMVSVIAIRIREVHEIRTLQSHSPDSPIHQGFPWSLFVDPL